VLHIDELPEGWMGKTHAMARAAVETTGDWLLFTDGDMLFKPDALARVLAFAGPEQADHVVLYPTLIFGDFGEAMMIGFLHAISIWAVRPWKVGDPAAKRDFIGIGAFNLIRRPVYDAVGGWGALRLEVLEDLRMGFTIKRAGYRQRAVYGRDLTRIRWAEGAYGIVTNMTKNLFALFRFRLVVASVALGTLILLCLLPLLGLGFGWAGFAPFLLMFGAMGWLYRQNRRLGLPGAEYALTFPVGSALFIFGIARSIVATLFQRGVNWRGTYYPLKELRKHAGPLR
jgi:glycosyltransferase involved in cell wall biosynthesis